MTFYPLKRANSSNHK